MKKVIGILIILVFISATLVVIFRAYIPSNNSEPKLELNTKDVSQKEKNKIINKVKTLKTSNGLYYSGLLNKEPDLYTTYYATQILDQFNKVNLKSQKHVEKFLKSVKEKNTSLYASENINNDLRSTSMAVYLLNTYYIKEKVDYNKILKDFKKDDGFYYLIDDEFNSLSDEERLFYKVEQTSSILSVLVKSDYFLNKQNEKKVLTEKYHQLLLDPIVKNNIYLMSIVTNTLKVLNAPIGTINVNLQIKEIIKNIQAANESTNTMDMIELITKIEGISSLYNDNLIKLNPEDKNIIATFSSALLKQNLYSDDIYLLNSLVKITSNMKLLTKEQKDTIYKNLVNREITSGIFPFQYELLGDLHSSLYAIKVLKGLEGIDSLTNSSINDLMQTYNNRIEKIIKDFDKTNTLPVIDLYDYIDLYSTLEMNLYHKNDLEKILQENLDNFKTINEKNIQDYYYNIRALHLIRDDIKTTPNNLNFLYHEALEGNLKTGEGNDADNLYQLMVAEAYALQSHKLSDKHIKLIYKMFMDYKGLNSDYSLRIYEMCMQTLFEFGEKIPNISVKQNIGNIKRSDGYALFPEEKSMDIVSTYRALLIKENF